MKHVRNQTRIQRNNETKSKRKRKLVPKLETKQEAIIVMKLNQLTKLVTKLIAILEKKKKLN